MSKQTYWTNPDGLYVGFGPRTEETTSAAAVSVGGHRQQVIVKIVGTDLADVDVTKQLVYGVTLPAGAYIESATIIVTTAFVGATAVMDIGTYLESTGAAVDDDGIASAVAVASLTLNAKIAGAGALVGTALASNQKIGVSYDTAAFTAGEAELIVEYVIPQA